MQKATQNIGININLLKFMALKRQLQSYYNIYNTLFSKINMLHIVEFCTMIVHLLCTCVLARLYVIGWPVG
ncbi:nicotinamide ribonucleoside (NR) uptake permease (PnuC) family protein, partial [Francisella tularensis subsp. holarctica]|nr:nicotinamide ribonucleoside (NR) uptake permease (PnuC) family protein [Francisella tularensis subsp. holarctica]